MALSKKSTFQCLGVKGMMHPTHSWYTYAKGENDKTNVEIFKQLANLDKGCTTVLSASLETFLYI